MTDGAAPILLAPAGDFESLAAALTHGADAIYFGVGRLNMRARASRNFVVDDLPEIVRRCRAAGVAAWMTLNTIVYEEELAEIETLCAAAAAAGVDAVIAADPAVIALARARGLALHVSVQANVSNSLALKHYARDAEVVVLARELNLAQIAELNRRIRSEAIRSPSGALLRTEVFVHGALCMAVAGRCGLSLAAYGASANRGSCLQNCRRRYTLHDAETGFAVELDGQYLMSPRDLCTVACLDRILDSGVSVLKIEGRGRSPDYTATVTAVYREAITCWQRGIAPDADQRRAWLERLGRVFNRGFWEGGYYLGEPLQMWARGGDSQASERKEFLGKVVNYYDRAGVAEVLLQAGGVADGDRLLLTGPTTGAVTVALAAFRANDAPATSAAKGDDITFTCPSKVRENDRVYKLVSREPHHDQ